MERVQILSFFWSAFSRIWTEYGDLHQCILDNIKQRPWSGNSEKKFLEKEAIPNNDFTSLAQVNWITTSALAVCSLNSFLFIKRPQKLTSSNIV